MKPISKSNLCLAAYLLLFGTLLGQDSRNVIDLDRVADLLKFPRSELVITDYLDQEKFIYTKKTSTEDQRGRMPPVDPSSIYQSYWIASKNRMHYCRLWLPSQKEMPMSLRMWITS